VQYVKTMGLIFSGDLISYSTQLDVDEQIVDGIPATLSLSIGAAVLWLSFGILFGYLSAVRGGRLTDRVLTIFAVLGISIPGFVLAAVLLYYLTFKVELFPASDYVPLTEDPLDWAYHLILPWTTLAILYVGLYSRVLRSNMLDVMNEDHVRTARAKGLPERQVRIRHVLRNSLIPVITLFGLDFGAVIAGQALLVETIFSLHGVGQYALESIAKLDLPPIMAVSMYGAFFVVLFNTLVDIAYAGLDPRVRVREEAG
jgi:peptide/nickel transport system permease protein